jgi:O-acetylhomoserine/O-acetylserine sulfhydrylase-like pyridoxal-dependent enzyme
VEREGYVYSRYENPTTAALEALVSVGLEDPADLREDFNQALEVA